MAQVKEKLWTLEEFLAFDDGTDTSYQLFEGRIVAMNPPLRGHAALVVRLARIIGNQLRPPCEVVCRSGDRSGEPPEQLVQGGPDRHLHARQLPRTRSSPSRCSWSRCSRPPPAPPTSVASSRTISRSPRCATSCWYPAWSGWSGTGGASRTAGSSKRIAARRTLRLSGLPVAIAMADLYDRILPG